MFIIANSFHGFSRYFQEQNVFLIVGYRCEAIKDTHILQMRYDYSRQFIDLKLIFKKRNILVLFEILQHFIDSI